MQLIGNGQDRQNYVYIRPSKDIRLLEPIKYKLGKYLEVPETSATRSNIDRSALFR